MALVEGRASIRHNIAALFFTYLSSDQVLAIRGKGKGSDGFPTRDKAGLVEPSRLCPLPQSPFLHPSCTFSKGKTHKLKSVCALPYLASGPNQVPSPRAWGPWPQSPHSPQGQALSHSHRTAPEARPTHLELLRMWCCLCFRGLKRTTTHLRR